MKKSKIGLLTITWLGVEKKTRQKEIDVKTMRCRAREALSDTSRIRFNFCIF